MKQKRMAMVCIRSYGRKMYGQFVRTLTERVPEWRKSKADLFVIRHGDVRNALPEELALMEETKVPVLNWDKKTNGLLSTCAVEIYNEFVIRRGYEFVGLLDDDGDFLDPVHAVDRFLKEFDRDPDVSTVGPINGFLLWRKFKNPKGPIRSEMKGRPWATFGCQVHRGEAVSQTRIVWRIVLPKLLWRSDVGMFLTLANAGWKIIEVNESFNHTCTGAFGQKKITKAVCKKRIADIPKNFDVLRRHFPKYKKDIDGIEKGSVRWYKRRMEKAKE